MSSSSQVLRFILSLRVNSSFITSGSGRSCSLTWGQALVFINRHSPTMNLVEEMQRGLIPPGLQSWPLQLFEHLINTTSVAPHPAGPTGCCPLYLLHLCVCEPVVSEFYNVNSKKVLHTLVWGVPKFCMQPP